MKQHAKCKGCAAQLKDGGCGLRYSVAGKKPQEPCPKPLTMVDYSKQSIKSV